MSGVRGEAASDLSLCLSAAGISWSVLRNYSSASAKEKAKRNGICERTELLEGELGRAGRAAGFPLISVLGHFLRVFPFCVAMKKIFGTVNTCSLGKDVGLPMDLLASLSKFCSILRTWRPTHREL